MSGSFLPFLYQTRTILRVRRLPVTSHRLLHLTSARARRVSKNDIPFVQDEGEHGLDGVDQDTRGTITDIERSTFEGIFADIAHRRLKPSVSRDHTKDPLRSQKSANRIMAEASRAAMGNGKGEGETSVSAQDPMQNQTAQQESLLRFPPSLRGAALRAFELLQSQPSAQYGAGGSVEPTAGSAADTPLTRLTADLNARKKLEQERVESLMAAATSDFELWDVMEKEVFTYPAKLGLIEPSSASSRSSLGEEETQETPIDEDNIAVGDEGADANQKLNLFVFGPLYPSFLLLGLRKLDQSFAKSSPLALSILPRIKALGLNSFVLGVTTPFCNELLRIYYERYGSVSKMLELLDEMDQSGVTLDEGTATIISRAYNELSDLADGEEGKFAEAIMTMPEYEDSVRDRLARWQVSVEQSIAESSMII
ncbi:hypothetical protein BX600DRAFT_164177 [Xylariales sp. PMI_506]|nr:hypothetical protein BX600DRAFT_164177 [Xylariales sp. PMI_506]